MDQVVARLDALLMVLKSCKGEQCTKPWLTLHPGGKVNKLEEALNPALDSFYAGQPKIVFEECALGYIIPAEGAMDVTPFYVPD